MRYPSCLHNDFVVSSGIVRNVTTFGIFVDCGVGQNGMIHNTKVGNSRYPQLGEKVLVRIIPPFTETKMPLQLLKILDWFYVLNKTRFVINIIILIYNGNEWIQKKFEQINIVWFNLFLFRIISQLFLLKYFFFIIYIQLWKYTFIIIIIYFVP